MAVNRANLTPQGTPAFKATGKGYYNKLPDFPATSKNGNAVLVNVGLPVGSKNREMWLFCTGIQTGFSVGGQYGQSASARTFYPNNLSQDPLTINGVVANQYEYDRLVEFVQAHHSRALGSWSDEPNNGQGLDSRGLLFSLFPWHVDTGRRTPDGKIIYHEIYGGLPGAGTGGSPGVQVQGYVQKLPAGHAFAQTARTYSLPLQVTYDFLAAPVHLTGELNKNLRDNYMQAFNQLFGRDKKGNLLPAFAASADTLNPADNSGFGNADTGADPYWSSTIPFDLHK